MGTSDQYAEHSSGPDNVTERLKRVSVGAHDHNNSHPVRVFPTDHHPHQQHPWSKHDELHHSGPEHTNEENQSNIPISPQPDLLQRMSHQQQRPLPSLNHYTPVTRFLTKQTLGFIPRLSPTNADTTDFCGSPSSVGGGCFPRVGSFGEMSAGSPFGLPSLSPQKWSTLSAENSPARSLTSSPKRRFPSPSRDEHSSGSGSTFGSSPQLRGVSPADSSTFTIPPLKRACLSPPTTPLPSLPYVTSALTLDDICQPFRYQRSQSCPSDAMARADAEPRVEPQLTTAVATAARPLGFPDIPMNRLERSNSVDAATAMAMRRNGEAGRPPAESIDLHQRLSHQQQEQQPLNSLADSAIHVLERRQGNQLSHDEDDGEEEEVEEEDEETGEFAEAPPCSSQQQQYDYHDNAHARLGRADGHEAKREKKLCAYPQCTSNAVTRGLCISHGGGRRCQRKGCTRGAQSKGLCVAHGGGRICRTQGCSNIQRSMGLCIRHGGGKRCSMAGCQKGVVRQDLCTAHGGKRKCKVEDCTKHVKKKGLCRSHANSMFAASSS